MRFDTLPEFISEDEQQALVSWFDCNLDSPRNLKPGFDGDGREYAYRFTSRALKGSVEYPDTAYRIFERIRARYGYEKKATQPSLKDGMFAIATRPGGDTFAHMDANEGIGEEYITFNILIQKPEVGGVLYTEEDEKRERLLEERMLHAYAASVYRHGVTRVGGAINRYLWVFRLLMPLDEWEPVA